MKIAIMTFADKAISAYSQYSIKRFQEYATANDYAFILGTELKDKIRHPSWGKIEMFKEYLANYDVVAFFDADIWIHNLAMRIESYLEDSKFISISVNGTNGGKLLNCGAIIAKNDWIVNRFFNDVWLTRSEKDTENFWEQDVINDLYPMYKPIINELPMRAINSYWLDDQFSSPMNNVYHWMGRSNENKARLFKQIANEGI